MARLIPCLVLALACESRYAYPAADSGETPVADTVAPVDAAEVTPACPDTPCVTAGAECVVTELFAAVRRCEADAHGCLAESVTPCAVDNTCVVTLEAGPTCVPSTNPCAGLPPCATVGATCDGDTAVVCEALPNGCLLESRSECGPLGLLCEGGSCVEDPCAAKVLCAEEKVFCAGLEIRRCAVDADGCLALSTEQDCAEIPGAECVEGNPPRCSGQVIGAYRVSVILDTSAESPLDTPLTALDRAPSVAGTTVAFRAATAAPATPASATAAAAVLMWDADSEVLSTVAQVGDPLPDAPAATFESFDALGANGPRVALPVPGAGALAPRVVFVANATEQRRAVMQQDGNGLDVIVSRQSVIPGTSANFVGLSEPTPAAELTFFNGNDFGQVSGVYRHDAGGALIAVATNTTTMPNGVGALTGVSLGEVGSDAAYVVGFGEAGFGAPFGEVQRAIYRVPLAGGPLTALVDRATPVPGQPEEVFSTFAGPVVVGEDLFFVGVGEPGPQKPLGPLTYKALYRVPVLGGVPEPMVDTTTPMPGGPETFAADASDGLSGAGMCTDGVSVIFRGVGTANQVITRVGVFAMQAGGDPIRILDTTQSIDGRKLTDLRIGRRCASAGRIVLHATFTDGGEAILLVTPAPP